MNQNPYNKRSNHSRWRLAGAIGGVLGGTAGFSIGKLIGFESFWLGMVIVAGGIGVGGLLAQKFAKK